MANPKVPHMNKCTISLAISKEHLAKVNHYPLHLLSILKLMQRLIGEIIQIHTDSLWVHA